MSYAKEVSSLAEPKSYAEKIEMVSYTFIYLKSYKKFSLWFFISRLNQVLMPVYHGPTNETS